MFVPPRYTEAEARVAIATSRYWTEALHKLGMRAAGGNYKTLQKYAEAIWMIPTDHFDRDVHRPRGGRPPIPLNEVLVEGSTYQRGNLKRRLYAAGLKRRQCEICGQNELWQDRRISLILDHINGVADDHRIENLRILCPNCAATLDTHCGRQNRLERAPRNCERCGAEFWSEHLTQRFCSRGCGRRCPPKTRSFPERRKVQRPPYTHLVREVRAMGFLATGRRYGVSDTAIRKWLRAYEHERAQGSSVDDGWFDAA